MACRKEKKLHILMNNVCVFNYLPYPIDIILNWKQWRDEPTH
jgi:hypothetical protein